MSSALSAEALPPRVAAKPSPLSQPLPGYGLQPPATAPYLAPQALAFAEPTPLGPPVNSKLASTHHFLQPGPWAGHSQGPSLPDSTAWNWLALGPPRGVRCPGREPPSSSVSSDGQGLPAWELSHPSPPFLSLSSLPIPPPPRALDPVQGQIRALPLSSCVTLSWSRTSLASVSACEAVAMTSSSRAWEKQGWPRVSAQLSARHTDRHLGVSGLRAPALLTRGGPADFLPLPQGRMELGAQHIGRTGCPGQVPPLPCLSWACCLLCARVGTQQ